MQLSISFIFSIIFALVSQLSEPSQNDFKGLKQCLNYENNKNKYKNLININMEKEKENHGHMVKGQNVISSSADDDSNTKNKTLKRMVIILFWNKYWNEGIMDGLGFQPFETCFHKNCFSSREKSLLYDPKYAVDAIVFYGGKDSPDDLKEMKQFKESEDLVEQNNQGIKPQVVLFMAVRL